jgi:hypothetical protein
MFEPDHAAINLEDRPGRGIDPSMLSLTPFYFLNFMPVFMTTQVEILMSHSQHSLNRHKNNQLETSLMDQGPFSTCT